MATKKKGAVAMDPEAVVASFEASPTETRSAELIERLAPLQATNAIACGLAVLERFPVSAVAAYVLGRTLAARADRTPGLEVLEARMRELAAQHKTLAAVFGALG